VSARLQLRFFENKELACTQELAGPVEMGRQREGEEGPYAAKREAGRWRIVIARRDEQAVPRQYVLAEPLAGGRVRLTNLSKNVSLRLPDGAELAHQAHSELSLPLVLPLGQTTIRLQEVEDEDLPIQGLAEATAPPRVGSGADSPFRTLAAPAAGDGRAFVRWLHAALDVLQSAAGDADFFDKAARAAVELVNLDAARVLRWGPDGWREQAVQTAPRLTAGGEGGLSQGVLGRLLAEKRTFWEAPDPSLPVAASLRGVKAVVAAPILDRHGAVIGALYGHRRRESMLAAAGPITDLEASLVELLARGVAAGLARLEQEQAILTARVQFEQFFTPQLARQLERHPDLLEGRDAEVTLLFCDIRGFSRISERLGPVRTVAWIRDTMAALSECVLAHDGVLVDYIGDELIAMWGAPEEQRDHARLACRAALDMLARLPVLDERWRAELKEPMGAGIGINTGVARVGNTGSPHKFKYSALGNDVNLASRVQGATKYLKCRLLITGATRGRLDDSFVARRLARVRVVNIAEPVDLYELSGADRPDWAEAKAEYERALDLFEKKEFQAAGHVLGNWRARMPDDGPALVLQHRAIQCEVDGPGPLHPLWELPGK
jgi:adenylate cyclase